MGYEQRLVQHKALFDQIDTAGGPARGLIGMDQFVEWASDHLLTRLDKIPTGDVSLLHPESYTQQEYLDFIEIAVNDKTSYNRSSFYNFMLNIFVERRVWHRPCQSCSVRGSPQPCGASTSSLRT